jgi:hypothetical protein
MAGSFWRPGSTGLGLKGSDREERVPMSSNKPEYGEHNQHERTLAELRELVHRLSIGQIFVLLGLIRQRFPHLEEPLQVLNPPQSNMPDPVNFSWDTAGTGQCTVVITFNRPVDESSVTAGETFFFSGDKNPSALPDVGYPKWTGDTVMQFRTRDSLDQIVSLGEATYFSVRLVGTDAGAGVVRDRATGQPLDGNGDGTPGGDYEHTFVIVG